MKRVAYIINLTLIFKTSFFKVLKEKYKTKVLKITVFVGKLNICPNSFYNHLKAAGMKIGKLSFKKF